MNESFRSALRHTVDCPPLESLIGNEAAFEKHTRTCPACQTELAMYRGFEAGEVEKEERSAVAFIVKRLQRKASDTPEKKTVWQRLFTPAWMGGAALAMAAVLLAVGLTPGLHVRTTRTTVPVDATLRTAAIAITSPTGDIAEVPSAIEWKPVEGAAEYSVTLSEVDDNIIFHTNVTTPRVLLPDNVRSLVVPGKRMLLDVTAKNSSGSDTAHSGTVSLRLIVPATNAH